MVLCYDILKETYVRSGAMYIHARRDTGGPMHQVTYTLHVKQSKENYVLVHLQFTLELYMYTQNLLS